MAKGLLDLAASMEKKARAIEEAASKLAVETAQTIVGDLTFKNACRYVASFVELDCNT